MSEDLQERWNTDLRAGVLRLPRCTACTTWNWYPLSACKACGGLDFAWTEVERHATLHSWTRVHRRFTARAIATPYLVGLVELVQAPAVRIACRIAAFSDAAGDSDPRIGATGMLEPLIEGDTACWLFRARA